MSQPQVHAYKLISIAEAHQRLSDDSLIVRRDWSLPSLELSPSTRRVLCLVGPQGGLLAVAADNGQGSFGAFGDAASLVDAFVRLAASGSVRDLLPLKPDAEPEEAAPPAPAESAPAKAEPPAAPAAPAAPK
jgi:hypothetical protein